MKQVITFTCLNAKNLSGLRNLIGIQQTQHYCFYTVLQAGRLKNECKVSSL